MDPFDRRRFFFVLPVTLHTRRNFSFLILTRWSFTFYREIDADNVFLFSILPPPFHDIASHLDFRKTRFPAEFLMKYKRQEQTTYKCSCQAE